MVKETDRKKDVEVREEGMSREGQKMKGKEDGEVEEGGRAGG